MFEKLTEATEAPTNQDLFLCIEWQKPNSKVFIIYGKCQPNITMTSIKFDSLKSRGWTDYKKMVILWLGKWYRLWLCYFFREETHYVSEKESVNTIPYFHIKNNGWISWKCKMRRGILQGCPVSVILFFICYGNSKWKDK